MPDTLSCVDGCDVDSPGCLAREVGRTYTSLSSSGHQTEGLAAVLHALADGKMAGSLVNIVSSTMSRDRTAAAPGKLDIRPHATAITTRSAGSSLPSARATPVTWFRRTAAKSGRPA